MGDLINFVVNIGHHGGSKFNTAATVDSRELQLRIMRLTRFGCSQPRHKTI